MKGDETTPWDPITDKVELKCVGKLIEELGELTQILGRTVCQGVDETDPRTGKVNRQAIGEEIADVYANIKLVSEFYALDVEWIIRRSNEKVAKLRAWHGIEAKKEAEE